MAKQQIPNAEDARQALESIQEMAQSARKRAQPPKWFGIVVALLAGSMVALAVADLRKWQDEIPAIETPSSCKSAITHCIHFTIL